MVFMVAKIKMCNDVIICKTWGESENAKHKVSAKIET